jgi:hypothetical protein
MPISAWFSKLALWVPVVIWGIGLLVVAGCGPPELGSVKLPAEVSQGAKLGFGPNAAKAGTRPLGPVQVGVAPKTKPGRRRGR